MRILFIGLGNMGGRMAARLAMAGHDVAGSDISDASVDALVQGGGRAANDEDVASADAIVTMLPAGQHVRDVYLGDAGLIARASDKVLLIDCSTIDVAAAREVAGEAAKRDLAMIDAPVSGGVGGAEAGTLTFMVGGPSAAVERARPLLDLMGRAVIHAGGRGAGQAAKICNNMILGVSMIAVSEAFALGRSLGLDDQKLFDVASVSSGQCWSLTTYCPVPGPVPASPANRDYAPGFTAAMMLKDLKLAQDARQTGDAKTPLGAEAAALYQAFVDAGHGEMDFSAIMKSLGNGSVND
ncbi:MAG: 3-hydroxyisobutyrate dehydrogenase [Pseudomonadota bacterium]